MVRANCKDRSFLEKTEFGNVTRFAIEHGPADAGADRGARDLRKRGGTYGFEQYGVGTLLWISLNDLQQLRALRDGVVARVDDLRRNIESARGFFRRAGLLDLIIVVVVGQRHEKSQFLHKSGLNRMAPVSKIRRLRAPHLILLRLVASQLHRYPHAKSCER